MHRAFLMTEKGKLYSVHYCVCTSHSPWPVYHWDLSYYNPITIFSLSCVFLSVLSRRA